MSKLKLGYKYEALDNWKAKWVTLGNGFYFINLYYRFRKSFNLPGNNINSATIRISADTRYKLWVNGVYVCRGPAKGYPWVQPYDVVDIKKYLKPGKNVLAVLHYSCGVSTSSNVWRNRAGIILDGEVTLENAAPVRLDTNSTWKAISDSSRVPETSRYGMALFFQEVFDAKKDEKGWTEIDFDDSKWFCAVEMVKPGGSPWYNMEERGTPLLSEEKNKFIDAVRFYSGKNHADWKNNSRLREILYEEKRNHIPASSPNNPIKVSKTIDGVESFTVKPSGKDKFLAVLLDTGRTSVGCPNIAIESLAGGEVVDLFYTMRSPDDINFMFKPKDYCEIALIDRYVCRKGEQEFEPFHFKGYRYLLLVFRNVVKPLIIKKIYHNFVAYPVDFKGKFECSDKELNKIWDVGRWTMRCCMLDSYVDCPDREQGQWMGDALVEEDVNFHAFGDKFLAKRLIRQGAQSQLPNKLLFGVFPTEAHSCILPDYNFTWLLAAERYYCYTGDISILEEIFPAAKSNLTWFEKFAGEKNLLGNPEGLWLFLDWSTIDKTGITASFNLWYLLGLQCMQRICKLLKQNGSHYRKLEIKLKKALLKTFYDRKSGCWYESYDPKTGKLSQLSQHANALVVLADLPVGSGGKKILKDSFYKESTYKNPRASSYFAYYVLEALFKLGERELALKRIKEGWGKMIKKEATTFWETWGALDGAWSVCHAWSAHPVALLSRNVLGLKATGANWKTFEFKPCEDLNIKWAKGVIPTSFGDIKAEWKRDKQGKLSYDVDYPCELKGYFVDSKGRRKKI